MRLFIVTLQPSYVSMQPLWNFSQRLFPHSETVFERTTWDYDDE